MIRLENVLKISLQDVLKTSWRCLEDVFQDVLKTFWRRLEDVLKTSWKRLEDVLKMSWRRFCKTSWRCLEDVFARRLEDVLKTSWKRLEDVLKTYGQDEYIGLDQDVLKMSSEDVRLRQTYSSWSRRLEDVLKMSSEDEDERRLEDAFTTSSSRRIFGGVYDRLHDFLEKKKSYFYSSLIFDRNVLPLLLWFISQIRLDERLIG